MRGRDVELDLGDLVESEWTQTYDEKWKCVNGVAKSDPVDGPGGRTNTATVTWNGGSDSDEATVRVGCGTTPPPPPPPPPPPLASASSAASASASHGADGRVHGRAGDQGRDAAGAARERAGRHAYTIRVRNNGPNQAHNVTLADARRAGSPSSRSRGSPRGSCALSGGNLLRCTLGTLGPGVERTIGFSARVTQTGTYVNSATGTGDGKDTNSTNNTDDASTLVTAR